MYQRDNIILLTRKIFKQYNIPVCNASIEETILSHPDYPSMQCFSDAFDKWKVKHIILKIPIKELYSLKIPFIGHLSRGEFVWISQITDANVCFWSSIKGNCELAWNEFEKIWSGVSLVIENIEHAGEEKYKIKFRKEQTEKTIRYATTIGILLLWLYLIVTMWKNDHQLSLLWKTGLLIVNSAGVYLSYILMRHEQQKPNYLINKFCTVNTYIDCNQVTSSRQAKLFGLISWAELGFSYFISVIIWITIFPFIDNWLPILWLYTLMVLPFTIWSLGVQVFIIRKWCLFCCAVVLLLWINSGILYSNITGLDFRPEYLTIIALLLLIFLITFFPVFFLSNRIKSKRQVYAWQRGFDKVKYHADVIQSQLSKKKYQTENVGLTWGDPRSTHEISLFVSTSCFHCADAVKRFRQIIEIYPHFFFRLIYFLPMGTDINGKKIVQRFFISKKNMEMSSFFDMLDDWYTHRKTPDGSQDGISENDLGEELDKLTRFAQESDVKYTPAIFINGHLLSQMYSVHDLYKITRTLNSE